MTWKRPTKIIEAHKTNVCLFFTTKITKPCGILVDTYTLFETSKITNSLTRSSLVGTHSYIFVTCRLNVCIPAAKKQCKHMQISSDAFKHRHRNMFLYCYTVLYSSLLSAQAGLLKYIKCFRSPLGHWPCRNSTLKTAPQHCANRLRPCSYPNDWEAVSMILHSRTAK